MNERLISTVHRRNGNPLSALLWCLGGPTHTDEHDARELILSQEVTTDTHTHTFSFIPSVSRSINYSTAPAPREGREECNRPRNKDRKLHITSIRSMSVSHVAATVHTHFNHQQHTNN
mmetsp:Transcript_43527/g.123254  ORF Transcript_43527/g.123254 Transcript_43527/m.123254 type:complete len:118 (+) Transcript_43527:130-483(+)